MKFALIFACVREFHWTLFAVQSEPPSCHVLHLLVAKQIIFKVFWRIPIFETSPIYSLFAARRSCSMRLHWLKYQRALNQS